MALKLAFLLLEKNQTCIYRSLSRELKGMSYSYTLILQLFCILSFKHLFLYIYFQVVIMICLVKSTRGVKERVPKRSSSLSSLLISQTFIFLREVCDVNRTSARAGRSVSAAAKRSKFNISRTRREQTPKTAAPKGVICIFFNPFSVI